MAEIDYYGIELAIGEKLEEKLTPEYGGRNLQVAVEEPLLLNSNVSPYVNLQLGNWESPEEGTTIGGNTPFLTFFTIVITCIEYSLDFKEGSKLRDKLIRKVKEIIKTDVILQRGFLQNNNVNNITMEGGDFRNETNFKGVTIELKVEVRE